MGRQSAQTPVFWKDYCRWSIRSRPQPFWPLTGSHSFSSSFPSASHRQEAIPFSEYNLLSIFQANLLPKLQPIPRGLPPCLHAYRSDTLHLSHPLGQFILAKFKQIVNALLTEVHTLDIGDILRRCPADPARHDHRINLQYDTVVDDLVDGEGDEVVVFY